VHNDEIALQGDLLKYLVNIEADLRYLQEHMIIHTIIISDIGHYSLRLLMYQVLQWKQPALCEKKKIK